MVGGGFHRYSVDERWLVPHFEKMLYDNALLASAYLHAWLVTGHERYREVVEETLEYMLRDLALDGGGLASAQDADTDGVEGLTYTWTPEEAAAARAGHGAAAAVRARPLDRPRRARAGAARAPARACARSGRSRSATTRRSPRGTASRSRPWRTPATGSSARTGSRRRGALRSSSSGRCRATTAACVAPGGTAASRVTASSRTTPTSPTACWSCTSPRARCVGCTRRGVSRCSPSSCSATASTAASSSRRRAARSSSRARSRSTTTRRRPGNSMLAHVLLRLARIWGDDELERQAVGVFRLVEPSLRRVAVGLRLDALRARPVAGAAAGDRGRGRRREPCRAGRAGPLPAPRRWPRSARPTTCRSSPARARRRQARRLRLRALRLPGARHAIRPAL